MHCFTNLTPLTRLAANTTSPNRFGADYSYFNSTYNGFFEIYRLRSKSNVDCPFKFLLILRTLLSSRTSQLHAV